MGSAAVVKWLWHRSPVTRIHQTQIRGRLGSVKFGSVDSSQHGFPTSYSHGLPMETRTRGQAWAIARAQCTDLIKEVSAAIASGKNPSDIRVDTSLPTLRDRSVNWILQAYDMC